MRRNIEMRGPFALLAITLAGSWSTTAAFAACGMAAVSGGGSGPPSISTTETSTTQVLEQIRRRTREAQSQQPIPVSNTTEAAPAAEAAAAQTSSASTSSSANASSGGASSSGGAKKAKPKSVVAKSAPSAPKSYDKGPVDDYAFAQQSAGYGGSARSTAVWSQSFLGYERHSNTAPGNQENPTRKATTVGGLIGADWTQVNTTNGVEALQYGVFTGYSDSRARKSDTTFTGIELPGSTTYNRTGNKEDIDGPFVGAYVAYVQNAWTFDTAFKADFFDLSQRSILTQTCGGADTGVQTGSASVTNYMIQANASRRYDLSEGRWFEPTAGIRYTYTDFGSDRSESVFVNGGAQQPGRLGLDDGSALRLQFGARIGERFEDTNGYIWTTTVGAFLYSDVLINGFDGLAGQSGEFVGPVDEGKLRALGQLETRINVGNGLSYTLQAEVRGGDDVFGAAGQVGFRYEW